MSDTAWGVIGPFGASLISSATLVVLAMRQSHQQRNQAREDRVRDLEDKNRRLEDEVARLKDERGR